MNTKAWERRDDENREILHKFFFLAETMIETMDQIEGTRFYKQLVKNKLNSAKEELEKEYKSFYFDCQRMNAIGKNMSGVDVYNKTSDAYEYMFEFFERMKPHEIISVVEILKAADELQNVKVSYKPAEI